jgi:7-keto-8-aminopelargonate synthetase-like enzyme
MGTKPTNTKKDNIAFTKSLLHFVNPDGRGLQERSQPYYDWANERRQIGVWPYSKVLMNHVGHFANVANEFRENERPCINFGSQDYLGMAQRSELKDAVRQAMDEFGVHSAGSPVLCGRTKLLLDLEEKFCKLLHRESCIIYPTGWAAGFGVISGLVRREDSIIIDALSHNCLQEGARHATPMVRKFAHNSTVELEKTLREERAKNSKNGLFVVIESLYSMDSDSPNLAEAIRLARDHEAIVILDTAHDFGSMGTRGLGLLETVPFETVPDVIMGSFSKTFAANGGFVACSKEVHEYLAFLSAPHIFSNAISPMQTAAVSRAFDIVFSTEGDALRAHLMRNVERLRSAMNTNGLNVSGTPSPIVPVFVGDEKIARLTSKNLTNQGLLANLVEFPAVARGKARFRFQVMATHQESAIDSAANIMARSKAVAINEWEEISK